MCGGTARSRLVSVRSAGLSPRVRGNRSGLPTYCSMTRSIPACAGEPDSGLARAPAYRVYPRVCGGTRGVSPVRPESRGLSPRVRGNPTEVEARAHAHRSIPACAGEPVDPADGALRPEVYPRVCGGTVVELHPEAAFLGLSPRVRGNLRRTPSTSLHPRSIPACAGEPCPSAPSADARGVYPRVCGGTAAGGFDSLLYEGLSPRVRGNLALTYDSRQYNRSIPACAGEPRRSRRLPRLPAVYPRVCGGT